MGVLGLSWEPLGPSWGNLGAILGRLGAKLGGLGAVFGALRFLIIFWSDFGSKKGAQRKAFWEPKRSKNRSKTEVQIQERKSHLLESSWSVLGRFPMRLEVKNVDFSLVFKGFREHQRF